MRYLRILALVALCLAYAPTPALAVTGYDSAYSGESAFVTINPGETKAFQVFFSNTGTLTWTKGGATQVDLAACLADKMTCNAQDPADSIWNSGWISTTRYATTTQATTAPGALATFAYNIKAPSNATAGTNRFNGDLVVSSSGARIHPEGYYQDATVQAIGNVPAPTPKPTPGSTPFPSAKPAPAPTPNPNPLLCFDGTTATAGGRTGGAIYGGTCTRTSDGAVLNSLVPEGASGAYAGVYYAISRWTMQPLSSITSLSFNYTGSPPGGGAPRISVLVQPTAGDPFYISAAAADCNNGEGLVDAIHDSTCTIWSNLDGTNPLASNWAALVAAHPDWTVSAGDQPAVVADAPGVWTVTKVHLGE